MTETTLFQSNRTQAVRLPKAVAFPDRVQRVEIRVVGEARVITPLGGDWDYWFENATPVTADFCANRDQPPAQERSWNA